MPISKGLARAILYVCWMLVGPDAKFSENPPHKFSALVDQDHLAVNPKFALLKIAPLNPLVKMKDEMTRHCSALSLAGPHRFSTSSETESTCGRRFVISPS
jgi:hypothetical protein